MKLLHIILLIPLLISTSYVDAQKKIMSNQNTTYPNRTNFPITYQPNTPTLPFYSYAVEIPPFGSYQLQVTYLDSIIYNDTIIHLSKGLEKKKDDFVDYDTSYFIERYDPNSFFPKKGFISFQPIIARDKRIQTFHIFPCKYKATTHELKVYTKFSVELIKSGENGKNELHQARIFNKTRNLYLTEDNYNSTLKYQPIPSDGEMLIVYKNTSDESIKRFSHWKNKIGITTHYLKLNDLDTTPEIIKQKIEHYYDSIPDILYLLLIGDENEIPPYLYKQYLNTDYYSDSYYGMIDGDDFVPELLVGRFSGTEDENKVMIDKTISYEQYLNSNNYEKNLMLIGSNQGENIGNNGDLDWEHLRKIGIYLHDSAFTIPSEYYDGSQGGLDASGNPTPQDIKDGINDGKGIIFYTGHGEFTSFTTGNFFTMHVKQLENYNRLPIVISAACDNGKFMDGLDCIGEVFNFTTKNNVNTGATAFMGSSILMSWAPPMQTQVEFSRLINPNNPQYQPTLGAAFYNAQLSMLEHYPTTFGEEVMQTWILLGDPSLKLRVNQQGVITVQHPNLIQYGQDEFLFPINENDAFVSLTQNDSVIATSISSDNEVFFSNLNPNPHYPIEIVASKANYVTYVGLMDFSAQTHFNQLNEIKLSPNPSTGLIRISTTNEINGMEVFDLQGRKIPFLFDNSSKIINLENVTNGIYLINIRFNNTIHTEKIEIRHD